LRPLLSVDAVVDSPLYVLQRLQLLLVGVIEGLIRVLRTVQERAELRPDDFPSPSKQYHLSSFVSQCGPVAYRRARGTEHPPALPLERLPRCRRGGRGGPVRGLRSPSRATPRSSEAVAGRAAAGVADALPRRPRG